MLGDDESEAARVVPSELVSSRMRACMSCSLVKSLNQFIAYGCENCPFMDYENDRERVAACTTPAFTGLYVTTKPKESWVAKWQRTCKHAPILLRAPQKRCSGPFV